MADTKISALSAATALDGTEPFPIVQGGNTVKATGAQMATYLGGMQKIANGVVSGSTITFSAIPGTYQTLKIMLMGRDTAAGTSDAEAHVQLNGDSTSANYTSESFTGFVGGGGNTAASSAGGPGPLAPGVSGNANSIGISEITIVGYAQTSFYKPVQTLTTGQGATYIVRVSSFIWKSTAAITSIVITSPTTAWATGSFATLYGLG